MCPSVIPRCGDDRALGTQARVKRIPVEALQYNNRLVITCNQQELIPIHCYRAREHGTT